jgi:novobiocin biosynthesis protein NovU/D-mycarose 3-C-methyltransferase
MFLDLGPSPIADAYTNGPDLDVPRYPLQVATCPKCRLVQLLEVVDPEILFGTGYSFYSSASPPLSAYHARYAADLLSRYPDQAAAGVLEIGCNDGDMLRHFAHLRHLGVDPARGPLEIADERGLVVTELPFSLDLAQTIDQKYGLVIANHVLAHVADVSDVLAGIAQVLHPDGLAFIEVQYLPDLLVNNAFDLVYHEHRNFFSLSTLEYALWCHGLRVIDAQLTDRQGGSLRVAVQHRDSFLRPGSDRVDRLRNSERWLQSFGAYEGMQGRAERIRDRLIDMLTDRSDRVVALYGAPAKATTLLNFCGLTFVDLPYCWDSTPAKQGRHIPGTGIEIRAPWAGARPDVFLLAAWNYLRPIMKGHPGFEWIVPFPAPLALS